KHHDVADHLLGRPGLDDPLFPFRPNPGEFSETVRGLLNHLKDLLAKGLGQCAGKVGPDAFDHPGAEIFFNAFQRAGWDDAERLRLELEPMRPISDPPALPVNILAWGNRRGGPDDGD